jgi:copper(I)-binding protein
MKIRLSFLASFILVAVLAACGSNSANSGIEIQDPWVRAVGAMDMSAEDSGMGTGTMVANNGDMSTEETMGSMIGSTGAAFMTIKNTGKEADKLVAANSDVADAVEIHISEMKDDVMTMRQVDGVDVPAGGEAVLKPGSYHIMLIGLKRELSVGEKVDLTLSFEKAGQISVEAEVRALP